MIDENAQTFKNFKDHLVLILETNVPKNFIDIINNIGDEVLSDEKNLHNGIGQIILLVKFTKKYKYQ